MEFALNYSPQAADLLRAGGIALDRFKCPDWPDLIATAAELRPVYIHFPLVAGSRRPIDWAQVAELLERTATPHVNLHLAPDVSAHPDIPPDSAEPAHASLIAERMLPDVLAACERFGPERVVVENIPYRFPSRDFLRASVEPAAIRRVVEEAGCRLLLDISHARITALHTGVDARAYIESLPVARLGELHITGIGLHQGQVTDHLRMSEGDWPDVEWALGRIREGAWGAPRMVALEYGGIGPLFEWRSDAAAIAVDVPRLYNLVHPQPIVVPR
ncbi:MAG: hypothetical protein RLZZ387_1941 [Chloroflexota bacterium]